MKIKNLWKDKDYMEFPTIQVLSWGSVDWQYWIVFLNFLIALNYDPDKK